MIAQVMYFFYSLFIFLGHSTREPASSKVTYFILRGPTQEPVLAAANTGKQQTKQTNSGEVLGKMQVNGPEG